MNYKVDSILGENRREDKEQKNKIKKIPSDSIYG